MCKSIFTAATNSYRGQGHEQGNRVRTCSNSGSARSNQWPYTVRDDSITIRQRGLPMELTVDKAGSNCRFAGFRVARGNSYRLPRSSFTRRATARQEHKYLARKSAWS